MIDVRYLSLFSGVEAATLAWKPLGWKPVAFAEFDAFPSAVLAHHYPDVPNLGDVTKIEGSRYCGTVDLIVGGSPCQGFSVAGQKKGLDDPRSALALAYVRLLDEVRPKWFVWENVPGVLSTNGGKDFKAFLSEITEIGYRCAWRVLDAQHVRVDGYPGAIPQRRRRLFVVGHLADWRYPAEVLFEQESLRGNPSESGSEGQGIAGASKRGSGAPDKDVRAGRAVTLKIRSGCEGGGKGALWQVERSATLATHNDQTLFEPVRGGSASREAFAESSFGNFRDSSGIAGTVKASGGFIGGGSENLVLIDHGESVIDAEKGGVSEDVSGEVMRVRRLTPIECERLMGFPDDYTKVPYRGKSADDCPDTPRYKACGNSMCVNVMRWIGERIQAVEERHVDGEVPS